MKVKLLIIVVGLILQYSKCYSQEVYTLSLKEAPLEKSSSLGTNSYDILDTEGMLEIKELEEVNDALFDPNNDWIISFGTAFAKNCVIGEFGVINGAAIESIGMIGFRMGSEFSLNKNFYIGPKVGFEADFAFISAKLNLINYTDFNYYEPKLTPEIGLSIAGYLNVTYGYNISLTSKRIEHIPTHRISITINIPLSTHPAP